MSTDIASPAAGATIRLGYADTPLGQLHYAEAGRGEIAVIALHQTPRSHDEFTELLPLLAAHHRVVAMDMYGFGQSAKPRGPQTIEQYAAGVVALADALELNRFAVFGHHTGAVVAIEVAADATDRVDAVVLSSPSFTGPEYRAHHAGGPGVDDAEIDAGGAHLVTWWSQRGPYYPKDRPDILNRFIRDALAPGVDPLEGHLACARYAMEDRIGRVAAPVLILGADADPFSFPDVEPTRRALTGAPRVDVVVIEGGTIPMLEHSPVPVASAVTSFLSEVSAAR